MMEEFIEEYTDIADVELTAELLTGCLEKGVGFNRDQAKLLGIPWPLKRGWRDGITDIWITRGTARELKRLKGRKLPKRQGKPETSAPARKPTLCKAKKRKPKKPTPAQQKARKRLLKAMRRDEKFHAVHCDS